MRPHAGKPAAAGMPEAVFTEREPSTVEWTVLRGAEPEVIVEFGGDGCASNRVALGNVGSGTPNVDFFDAGGVADGPAAQ